MRDPWNPCHSMGDAMRPAILQLVHHSARVVRAKCCGWSQPITLTTADCWEAELDLGGGRVVHVPGFYRSEHSAKASARAFALRVLGRALISR